MTTFEIITIILLAVTAVLSITAIVLVVTGRQKTVLEIKSNSERNLNDLMRHNEDENDNLREIFHSDITGSRKETIDSINTSFKTYGDLVAKTQGAQAEQQDKRLSDINETLSKYTLESEQKLENIRQAMTTQIGALTQKSGDQLTNMRETMATQIGDLTQKNSGQLDQMRLTVDDKLEKNRQTVDEKLEAVRQTTINQISELTQKNNEQLQQLRQTVEDRLEKNRLIVDEKLEFIRKSTTDQIGELTQKNSEQLEQMRQTVDEKLQKTLESRIGESFRLVNERLEQVYKGLGEMQSLAAGVGDLKKVLSNVKTRGILGEVQLGSILEQILAPEQYDTNIATRPGSSERVEYAVRLPGNGDADSFVYLPIDAKFPGDAYSHLMDAYETGDPELVEAAAKDLERVIKSEARDIRDKYVDPPYTTDFGIMFLPVEGLYAEVVRRGLLEQLQREYKVNIAGPTTMAALLNSLQMGFRTLAIEKHTSEVWETLGAVKTEFDKFEEVLNSAQKRLNSVGDDLNKLIGTRTRSIKRKLRSVESLEDSRTVQLLETGDLTLFEEDNQ